MGVIDKRDSLGRIKKGNNFKHGLSKEPIYDCWVAMKARCNNPQHPEYHRYGGRGIKVCERWKRNFLDFLKDMGKKPLKTSTLDRIDNNGNYEPTNCRWISIQKQQVNRNNNNIVPGVHYEKTRKKWHVDITRQGVKHFLGRYEEFCDAVKARKLGEKKYGL